MMAAGTRRRRAPKRKGKPFMKDRQAGKRELKTPVATREHSPSTQATAAKRAPGRRGKKGRGGSSSLEKEGPQMQDGSPDHLDPLQTPRCSSYSDLFIRKGLHWDRENMEVPPNPWSSEGA